MWQYRFSHLYNGQQVLGIQRIPYPCYRPEFVLIRLNCLLRRSAYIINQDIDLPILLYAGHVTDASTVAAVEHANVMPTVFHRTAADTPRAALAGQEIWPYSDLLLHDLGDALADHRSEFKADGREWRTPPLWGIGLAQTVNPRAGFLHDGRARTLEEAILWHGGEARPATDAYRAMDASDRASVVRFLESL